MALIKTGENYTQTGKNRKNGVRTGGDRLLTSLANQASFIPVLGGPIAFGLGMLDTAIDATGWLLKGNFLSAATVAVAGTIGFVGLVVPHALRGMVGPLHRRLLPAVFLAGGAFTVVADAVARTVVSPAELPVGVITALVGVPLFAILLRRSLG